MAIAGVALIVVCETIEPSVYLYQGHSREMVALGIVGWFIATLGPLLLSIGIRLSAHRIKVRWVLHAMFIPLAILIYDAGASLLFHAADVPDDDSIEGYTLTAATLILLVALIAHAIALAAEVCRALRSR